MACQQMKIVGRDVALEYAIGCGDTLPTESEWKRFGSLRTKEFNLAWDTTDATDSDSIGALRENLATFQTLTISGDGTVKVAGGGAANLKELTKHVAKPVSTGGQPTAWMRMTFPDLTFIAFMLLTTLSRSSPHDDIVTYSMEASATASDFGLIIEDTPNANDPDPESIEIIPSELSLAVGTSFDAEAVVLPTSAPQNIRWSSSAPAVASVNLLSGVVTGNALGTATITATSAVDSGVSESITVNVVGQAQSIEATPSSISIAEAATQQITASVLPVTAPQGVTYVSANPAIASVSTAGLVTGESEGETTITIRSVQRPSVSLVIPVTVTEA